MAIKVSAALFRACSEFVSKEDTRYYLSGVCVQPHAEGGAVLVATDGPRMLVAHDVDASCDKSRIVHLPKDAAATLAKVIKTNESAELTVDDDGIVSCSSYRSTDGCFIDGTFPDWPRALRPALDCAKARFYGKPVFAAASMNGNYVGSFGKAANMLSPSSGGDAPIRLVTFTESDPALVLFPNHSNVFGVLMPMRAPVIGDAFPAFMKSVFDPPKQPQKRRPAEKQKPAKRKAA